MNRSLRTLPAALACLLIGTAESAPAQKDYKFEKEPGRHALVIGNPSYQHLGGLPSAGLDAAGMMERLQALGFEVERVPALTSVRELEDRILPEFRRGIAPGDLVVFYYSGHGFTYGAHNFIVPSDLPREVTPADIQRTAVAVESVEDYLTAASPGLLVLLVDACRAIGGFVITEPRQARFARMAAAAEPVGQNLAGREVAAQKPLPGAGNTLVGYASRSGYLAEGSSAEMTLSVFTKSLLAHIDREGHEFSDVFREVAADVRDETEGAQVPVLLSASPSRLYLKPSKGNLAEQKEAWLAALNSERFKHISKFHSRHPISRHAAAASEWLTDHKPAHAHDFTWVSPVAVERAWNHVDGRLAIVPLTAGFAYRRTLDVAAAEAAGDLQDRVLGLVPSGARAAPANHRISTDLEAIQAHGTVVTTRAYVGRSEPSASADVVSRLPYGTAVTIGEVADQGSNGVWLSALVAGRSQPVYLRLSPSPDAAAPVELGRALREVIAPPRAGMSDLVDPDEIAAALADLAAGRRTVTWVSIAVAATDDPDEADLREARLTHVEYLLNRAGVDRRRITSVAAAPDLAGDSVRLRFFGF